MSELMRSLILAVAFVAFISAVYLQAGGTWRVHTAYANRFTRKAPRWQCGLTRRGQQAMSSGRLCPKNAIWANAGLPGRLLRVGAEDRTIEAAN
jgi:hypothetical protein